MSSARFNPGNILGVYYTMKLLTGHRPLSHEGTAMAEWLESLGLISLDGQEMQLTKAGEYLDSFRPGRVISGYQLEKLNGMLTKTGKYDKRIVSALSLSPMSFIELSMALSVGYDSIRTAMKAMRDRGDIKVVGSKRVNSKTRPRLVFGLTSQPAKPNGPQWPESRSQQRGV